MPKIVDQYGRPIETGSLTEAQSAKLLSLTRNFQTHPSRGLTPARLAQILEQAEQGDVLLQLELYEDMTEKDGHLYAELAKRQRALLTVDWDIAPPPNATEAEKSAAADIKERFESLGDFEDVILGAAAAIGPAFSCQEIEWELVGRDWMPKCIDFRPHTWFTLDRETRSQVLLRSPGTIGEALNPFGWITHIHRAKPGYLARAGLMRQLVWPYIFKTYSIGDLAEFLEIYGLPIRVGTYPAQATKEEKATLLRAVAALGHDAAGIIPEGMVVDFKEPADGKQEPFMAMIELMERTESKVILGATLTSQADGKSSTNALGVVHNEVRLDILASDARQIASSFTRDLVYPIGVLNGLITDPRRRPRFVFDVQEEEDFKTMAEALKVVIVDMGVKRAGGLGVRAAAHSGSRGRRRSSFEPPAPAAITPVTPVTSGAASTKTRGMLCGARSGVAIQGTIPLSLTRSRWTRRSTALDPDELQKQGRGHPGTRGETDPGAAALSTRSRWSSRPSIRTWIRRDLSSCSSVPTFVVRSCGGDSTPRCDRMTLGTEARNAATR
jgi:phage gp29-like protein